MCETNLDVAIFLLNLGELRVSEFIKILEYEAEGKEYYLTTNH